MQRRFRLHPDAFYVGLITSSREWVEPDDLTFPTRAEVTPLDELVLINAQQNMEFVALDLTISDQPPVDLPHRGVSTLGGPIYFDCGPGGGTPTDVVLEPGGYDVFGEIEHIDNPYADDLPDQRCAVWLVRRETA